MTTVQPVSDVGEKSPLAGVPIVTVTVSCSAAKFGSPTVTPANGADGRVVAGRFAPQWRP